MTKQEALQKIDELKKFVEGCDKVTFKVGDVFKLFGNGTQICILETKYGSREYVLGGLDGDPTNFFSDPPRTNSEVVDYLTRNEARLVGRLAVDLFVDYPKVA